MTAAPGTGREQAPVSTTAPASVQRHTHVSGLHAVAAALDSLHRDVIRTSGAELSRLRLSVLNIVAACTDPALVPSTVDTVLRVAARHPARAIVILADPKGEPMIESDISLRRSDSGDETELVQLEVRGEPAYHLASIVQPLLIPDIPVHLWLVGAPPLTQAFRPETVALCQLIILDTAAYADTAAALQEVSRQLRAHGDALRIGDVAWERLRPWREAIATAFDGPAVRPWLQRIVGIDIVSSGDRPGVEAWLLGGWMTSRLRRPEHAVIEPAFTAIPHPSVPPGGLVRVRVRCGAGRHTARVEVERRSGVLHTLIDVDAGVVASTATTLPPWTDAFLIARLMTEEADDRVYREAVLRAAALAETFG